MFLAPWLVLATLCSAEATPAGAGGEQVVDRIVAILDRQPLLLSELQFEVRIALIQQGGTEAATAPLSDEDLAAALEWAIGQRLALREADRLQVFDVEEADVTKALKAFEGQLGGPGALQAFLGSQEATVGQLSAVLLRDLRVARFLDSKVKLSVRVSEDELTRYWALHSAEYGGAPYEAVRGKIKERLTAERVRTLTKKQLDDLRAKADVRIVAPFGRRPKADSTPARP